MRTTLTLEDNIVAAVEKFRQKSNMSLKDSVNHLLRAGLQTVEKKPDEQPYSGPVFDNQLRPGIDPNRMNQLADELDVADFDAPS